jgi:hypothetical protein
MDAPTEVIKTPTMQVREVRENMINRLMPSRNEPQLFPQPGMPFCWAAGFALLCLGSIWLGHYLTIQGQQTMLLNQKQQILMVPQTTQPTQPVTKVEPDKSSQRTESTQRTEQALGTIAASIDGTSQNMNKLVDAVNLKFTKVQEQIADLGTKIESMPKEGGTPVDLTPIKSALASLSTTLSDTKNVDVIVASIKETSQRQDQAFKQLNTTVEELQKAVKDNTLKVNSTLGEKFPPKK